MWQILAVWIALAAAFTAISLKLNLKKTWFPIAFLLGSAAVTMTAVYWIVRLF